jgi:exopolyphosphatase/pppGpp-phosphohydrolase
MPAAGGGVTLAGAIHAIELGTVPPVFRVGWPGLEPGREEVIAAGAIIIRTIMETLGGNECLVSDLGLREGVLIDLAMQTGNR